MICIRNKVTMTNKMIPRAPMMIDGTISFESSCVV